MASTPTSTAAPADQFVDSVPVGVGPPTHAELVAHYPAQFTWEQLRAFLVSGDLRLMKRHHDLNRRYHKWCEGIKREHGTMVNYLVKCRLQWGTYPAGVPSPPPSNTPQMEYFTANTPSSQLCIMLNDWPYSIPPSAQHFLVWSKLPILHPALVDERIAMRLDQDGLCGFTGTDAPDPTTADLQRALPALGAWGITMDSLVTSPDPTEDEARMMERAAEEVRFFVMRRWREEEWETTWFVNPPRTQSVPGLAHFHVFARRKAPAEVLQRSKQHETNLAQ